MKIQVFSSGGGCAPCKTMLRNVETAVSELGLDVRVEYVTRMQQMLDLGITGTPALVVDGLVKSIGKALDVSAVKAILTVPKEESVK